jgi:biofilm PGA synthesis N-glycosyltransferase PgaC
MQRALVACGIGVLACVTSVASTRLQPLRLGPELRQSSTPSSRPASSTPASSTAPSATPEAPRESVDLSPGPAPARTVRVPKGGDLQRALDEARPGDRIELENGATYLGPFRLRRVQGNGWIVLTSADRDGLPAPGERVDPRQASRMAKLRASSGAVVTADPGAHHYRFERLDIAPAEGRWLNALLQLGNGDEQVDDLPHHIIVDQCYLHGDPEKGTRRGVAMNSSHTAVINSYLFDFKEVGADTQAIAGWNGPGPFTIANNYLEAAGENVMFGGADPAIQGLVPADIRVTHNHLSKPLQWMKDRPEFEGTAWTVKNLFELKNARRVFVDDNLLEYTWAHAQTGFAILLTVRNQDGRAPWSTVEDVAFTNNVVRHAGGGINILGTDDVNKSAQTRRFLIRGNLFVDIGGPWGHGRLFQLLDGARDVTISHNTAFQTGPALVGGDHAPHTGFRFENNVVLHNEYGIIGSGTGVGRASLERYFPGAVVRHNVLVGGQAASYPPDNYFPASLDAAGFVRSADGTPRPAPTRRGAIAATAGTGGVAIGADIDARIEAARNVASVRRERASAMLRNELIGVRFGGFGGLAWMRESGAADALFWASLLLLVYTYAGYPMVAWLRSRLWPRRHVLVPSEPTVSIVVVARNEGHRIDARIENLLALDYPPHRREIIIGSDGSVDDTASRAARHTASGLRVEAFQEWRGKPAVLNELILSCTGEIVLLADARQRFDPDVLRTLVAHFADPAIGAVSGELILTDEGPGTSIARGTGFYWRYEKFIRLHESRASSTVGATGAIYAIRRALFTPIPTDTILDDVLIPLRIVRQGYSVKFEPRALAFDAVSASARQEWTRKLRTIAGTFQLFVREKWLLNPLGNPVWFETISHKALRLALPVLHGTVFVANLALAGTPFYQVTLGAQVAFYGAAAIGHTLRYAERRPIVLAVPYAMCVMIWATVGGFVRFITNRQQATWEQTAQGVSHQQPRRTHDNVEA